MLRFFADDKQLCYHGMGLVSVAGRSDVIQELSLLPSASHSDVVNVKGRNLVPMWHSGE